MTIPGSDAGLHLPEHLGAEGRLDAQGKNAGVRVVWSRNTNRKTAMRFTLTALALFFSGALIAPHDKGGVPRLRLGQHSNQMSSDSTRRYRFYPIQMSLVAGAPGRTVVFQSRVLVCARSLNTIFSSSSSPSII